MIRFLEFHLFPIWIPITVILQIVFYEKYVY